MDPQTLGRWREALAAQAGRLAGESRLGGWVLAALADSLAAPAGPLRDVCAHWMQVTARLDPPPDLGRRLLAALHWLALTGAAPALARYFPTAGGAWTEADQGAVAAAALDAVRRHSDGVLDFLLGRPARRPDLDWCPALLLGALAAARRFGGGLCLLELGAGAGLHLALDRYRYTFRLPGRSCTWGAGAVHLAAEVLPAADMEPDPVLSLLTLTPPVVGRMGIDPEPWDLGRAGEVRALAAFLRPEDTEGYRALAAAAAAVQAAAPELIPGDVAAALPAVLERAYAAMPAGNTLLIFHAFALGPLPAAAALRTAAAIQSMSARLVPGKPLAWLQLEAPPGAGPAAPAELRLFTFSDRDPEEREERVLARVLRRGAEIRWEAP